MLHRELAGIVDLLMVEVPLEKIPYSDYPEIYINKNESIEMPFRYVKRPDGSLVMPEVREPLSWWRRDTDDTGYVGAVENRQPERIWGSFVIPLNLCDELGFTRVGREIQWHVSIVGLRSATANLRSREDGQFMCWWIKAHLGIAQC